MPSLEDCSATPPLYIIVVGAFVQRVLIKFVLGGAEAAWDRRKKGDPDSSEQAIEMKEKKSVAVSELDVIEIYPKFQSDLEEHRGAQHYSEVRGVKTCQGRPLRLLVLRVCSPHSSLSSLPLRRAAWTFTKEFTFRPRNFSNRRSMSQSIVCVPHLLTCFCGVLR